jgi:ribosomal protein S27AE
MGRNARRRAEQREASRPHGSPGQEAAENAVAGRCPRCGSTNVIASPQKAAFGQGVEMICGRCNWQWMLSPW